MKQLKKIDRYLNEEFIVVGWSEWCSLPQLQLPAIKAKIDTGARTSAIHAFNITPHIIEGVKYVEFDVYPLQGNDKIVVHCQAPVIDNRYVMSSSGHQEQRYVIKTVLQFEQVSWEIEMTLSNRDPLKYRVLLGREALQNKVIIDPRHHLVQGTLSAAKLKKLYRKEIET